MSVNGRWRYGGATVVALLCAGPVAFTVPSAGARTRAVAAHAPGCGNTGSTSIALVGRGSHLVSEVDVPVCASGRLTVAFAGDPATGCAAAGLCDYVGTETFAPGGGNDLNLVTTAAHGHRTTSGTLFLGENSAPATSAVQRTVSTAGGTATTSCSDTVGSGNGVSSVFDPLRITGGRATIDLVGGQPSLLGSRCAGPLDADIASALPARTVALRTLEHGRAAINLSGSGSFAAHGWSGTVTSTIVLTLGRPQREHQTPAAPARRGSRTLRIATADYRVTGLAGSAVASVRSSATPAACGPFDACGLAGTITVRPGAAVRGSAFLTSLPSRAPRRELLAVLRGATHAPTGLGGGGEVEGRGSVRAALTQDGMTCSDTVALRQSSIDLTRTRHGLEVAVTPSQSAAADPLRTRCPGPDLGSHWLVRGVVPLSDLGRRAFTVALRGEAFGDGPYRVTTHSTLRLSLRRTATRVRVLRVVAVRPGPGLTRAG